jgi:hypothetical protein
MPLISVREAVSARYSRGGLGPRPEQTSANQANRGVNATSARVSVPYGLLKGRQSRPSSLFVPVLQGTSLSARWKAQQRYRATKSGKEKRTDQSRRYRERIKSRKDFGRRVQYSVFEGKINRRLLEVERVSHNSGLSGDSIQRVVQPTVTEDGEKAPSLKFGQPRVMALLLALTLFQHLIDGFHNRDLRGLVCDLLGLTTQQYTASQMTYDLRRLRLKGLIYRPPKTNRYFVTPYGWKVARLFSRLEARVFRPAMAMFTANDAVLPFPLRQALDRVDAQPDQLIYGTFPLPKAG